jgi:hypothetical protein
MARRCIALICLLIDAERTQFELRTTPDGGFVVKKISAPHAKIGAILARSLSLFQSKVIVRAARE